MARKNNKEEKRKDRQYCFVDRRFVTQKKNENAFLGFIITDAADALIDHPSFIAHTRILSLSLSLFLSPIRAISQRNEGNPNPNLFFFFFQNPSSATSFFYSY